MDRKLLLWIGLLASLIWMLDKSGVLPAYEQVISSAGASVQIMDQATVTPFVETTPTPAPRPPAEIGGNVNLVVGAGLLVLIAFLGVLWSSRRRK
jgi:hypothetical protein